MNNSMSLTRVEPGIENASLDRRWSTYQSRFRNGEWRAPIFRDMILEDAERLGGRPTFLDIGCGRGFDDDLKLQQSLAEGSERYIGIEPDAAIALGPYFTETYRCIMEDAAIEANSVDVAMAVMVLEHLAEPRRFFDQVFRVLKPGGVFWGLTPDFRHFGMWISQLLELVRLKDLYLRCTLGPRGVRYENYRTFYRANSPARIESATLEFSSRSFMSFSRIGQLDGYIPRYVRPATHLLDRILMKFRYPGALLAVRLQK